MHRSPFFATFFPGTEPQDTATASPFGGDLVGHVQTLTRTVFDLQLVVAALVETLHKIELVNPALLREAVEVELSTVRETLQAQQQAQMAALRERLHAENAAAQAAVSAGTPLPSLGHAPRQGTVTCAKCGAEVPAGRTTITESGTVCDQCAA